MAVPSLDRERSKTLERAIKNFRIVLRELMEDGVTQSEFHRTCKSAEGTSAAKFMTLAETIDQGLAGEAFKVFTAFNLAEQVLIRSQRNQAEKISNFPVYVAATLSLDPENISLPGTATAEEFPWWSTTLKPANLVLARELTSSKKSFTDIWNDTFGSAKNATSELSIAD